MTLPVTPRSTDRSEDQCTLRVITAVRERHPLEYVGVLRVPRLKRTGGLRILDRAYLHIQARVNRDLMAQSH